MGRKRCGPSDTGWWVAWPNRDTPDNQNGELMPRNRRAGHWCLISVLHWRPMILRSMFSSDYSDEPELPLATIRWVMNYRWPSHTDQNINHQSMDFVCFFPTRLHTFSGRCEFVWFQSFTTQIADVEWSGWRFFRITWCTMFTHFFSK